MALETLIEYKKMLDRAIEILETYPKLRAEIESLEKQLKEKKKVKKKVESELKELNEKLAEAGFSIKVEEIMKEPVIPTPKTTGMLQIITDLILNYKPGEIFRPKDVYNKFSPEIKERYPNYSKIGGYIGYALIKLTREGKIRKIGFGTYERVSKIEEGRNNPTSCSQELISEIYGVILTYKPGERFSYRDVKEKLLQDMKTCEYRRGLLSRIFSALKLAVESGKVRRVGRGVYERLFDLTSE